MQVHVSIPLFLLPAFLLTSDIILVAASASTGTIPASNAIINKPRSQKSKFGLTTCAKQCRAEFFQYCHTRVPPSKDVSNVQDTEAFRKCMCVDKSGAQYMDYCARNCNNESGAEDFPEQVGEMRTWLGWWCEKHSTDSSSSATGQSFNSSVRPPPPPEPEPTSSKTSFNSAVRPPPPPEPESSPSGTSFISTDHDNSSSYSSGVRPPPPPPPQPKPTSTGTSFQQSTDHDSSSFNSAVRPPPPPEPESSPSGTSFVSTDHDDSSSYNSGVRPPPPPPPTSPSSTPTSTPTPERKSVTTSVFAVGASVTFASAFLFLGYVMFMRRSKYARRRGVLAWLRLKLLERGYHGSLPRSKTTAMRMRVSQAGQIAVVGNPKWLDRRVPPLPTHGYAQSTRGSGSSNTNLHGHPTHTKSSSLGFLTKIVGQGRNGHSHSNSLGGLSRGGVWGVKASEGKRRSHRYSQGWINAQKKYTDVVEEDEKAEEYFRSKGIARSGKYMGVGSTDDGVDANPDQSVHQTGDSETTIEEKTYGDGGLVDEDDGEENQLQLEKGKQVSRGHRRNYSDASADDYGVDERSGRSLHSPVGSRSNRERSTSPDADDMDYEVLVDISATPHLGGTQWDSWTGSEGAPISATGGLRQSSQIISDSGSGGTSTGFEDVNLVEVGRYDSWGSSSSDYYNQPQYFSADAFGSAPGSGSGSGTQDGGASRAYRPVIEPDPQHGKRVETDVEQQQHRTKGRKWRLGVVKGSKAFLGLKGKRGSGGNSGNGGSSGSGDTGRGAYGTI